MGLSPETPSKDNTGDMRFDSIMSKLFQSNVIEKNMFSLDLNPNGRGSLVIGGYDSTLIKE